MQVLVLVCVEGGDWVQVLVLVCVERGIGCRTSGGAPSGASVDADASTHVQTTVCKTRPACMASCLVYTLTTILRLLVGSVATHNGVVQR